MNDSSADWCLPIIFLHIVLNGGIVLILSYAIVYMQFYMLLFHAVSTKEVVENVDNAVGTFPRVHSFINQTENLIFLTQPLYCFDFNFRYVTLV